MTQELKKIWNIPMVLLAAGVLLVTVFLSVNTGRWDYFAEDDALYRTYINRWEGRVSPYKTNRIMEEGASISQILSQKEEMLQAYQNGELDGLQYDAYLKKLDDASLHEAVFFRMQEEYFYLLTEQEKGIENLQLLYGRYWNYFFQTDTVSLLLLFLTLGIVIRCFFLETSTRMLSLLKASCRGYGGVMAQKGAAVACSIGIIAFLTEGIRFLVFWLCFSMKNGNAALQSLSVFADVNMSLGLGSGVILVIALQVAGCILTGLVGLYIAMCMPKELPAVGLLLVILFLPYLLRESVPWLFSCSLYSIMTGTSVLQTAALYGVDAWREVGIMAGISLLWGLVAGILYWIGKRR